MLRAPHQAHFCSPPHLAPALAPYPPHSPLSALHQGTAHWKHPCPKPCLHPNSGLLTAPAHTHRDILALPIPNQGTIHCTSLPCGGTHNVGHQGHPAARPQQVPCAPGCPSPPRSRHETLSQALSRPGRAWRWDQALQGSTCSPAQLPTPPSRCRNHPDCSTGRSDPVLKHIPAEAQSHPGE